MRFSPRTLYRQVSIAEAITWTLLIGGMILKYGFDAGPLPVKIGGFLHGLVFLTYGATAIIVGWNQRWSAKQTAAAVGTAIIPWATIPFDHSIDRRGLLDGEWRTAATEGPEDKGAFNSLMLWFLARPVLFFTTMIVGIAMVMGVLLFLGPPGGPRN